MPRMLIALRRHVRPRRYLLTRGWRVACTIVLGLTALAVTGEPVGAQTAGTAGAAPEVAPVITSPPRTIVSPGVRSASPQEASGSAPAVGEGEVAPGVGAIRPETPSGPVVIPRGMPNTGDGSLAAPQNEADAGT